MNYNYSIYSYRTTYFVLSFNFGGCVFFFLGCMQYGSIVVEQYYVCVRSFCVSVPVSGCVPVSVSVLCLSEQTTKQICRSLIYLLSNFQHTLRRNQKSKVLAFYFFVSTFHFSWDSLIYSRLFHISHEFCDAPGIGIYNFFFFYNTKLSKTIVS